MLSTNKANEGDLINLNDLQKMNISILAIHLELSRNCLRLMESFFQRIESSDLAWIYRNWWEKGGGGEGGCIGDLIYFFLMKFGQRD